MTMPAPAQRRTPTGAADVPAPRRAPETRTPTVAAVTARDRSILMAVAAGRCTLSSEPSGGLLIDGHPVADQFAARRLVGAGLVRLVAQPPGRPSTTELTATGIALLGLPITV